MQGKTHGTIIDHVSNYKRHRFPDWPRAWTLDRREKRAKNPPDPNLIDLTACRECSRPYERALPACPHCGHRMVPEPRERTLETVDGDLMLLDRATIDALYKAATLEEPQQVAGRVAAAAGEIAGKGAFNRQTERIEAQQRLDHAIAVWAGGQRALGRSDSESYRRFYLALGMDVLSARALPRAEMDKLREQIEQWG